jgi:hypothetical protein
VKQYIECPTCRFTWVHQEHGGGRTEFSELGRRCSSCRNLSNMVNVIHGHLMDGQASKAEQVAGWVRETWPDGYRRKQAA